jgi:hypothetical protein
MDLRAEHDEPDHGFVASAQYFHYERPLLSWLDTVRGWFGGSSRERGVRLRPPFDAERRDVFGYFSGELPPLLDGANDPLGAIRLARGTIVPLSPRSEGDDVVLRDYWACDPPAWRLTDIVDFGLQTQRGTPIAVCCAQCPLVIADVETGVFDDELSELHPHAMSKCELEKVSWRGRTAQKCTLRAGDTVEVLGVVWHPERCRSRFDVVGRGGPFRAAAAEPVRLVLGDERGTRMVIRKLCPPPLGPRRPLLILRTPPAATRAGSARSPTRLAPSRPARAVGSSRARWAW